MIGVQFVAFLRMRAAELEANASAAALIVIPLNVSDTSASPRGTPSNDKWMFFCNLLIVILVLYVYPIIRVLLVLLVTFRFLLIVVDWFIKPKCTNGEHVAAAHSWRSTKPWLRNGISFRRSAGRSAGEMHALLVDNIGKMDESVLDG